MNYRLFFPKPPSLCGCPQREPAGSLTGGQLVIFMPLPCLTLMMVTLVPFHTWVD